MRQMVQPSALQSLEHMHLLHHPPQSHQDMHLAPLTSDIVLRHGLQEELQQLLRPLADLLTWVVKLSHPSDLPHLLRETSLHMPRNLLDLLNLLASLRRAVPRAYLERLPLEEYQYLENPQCVAFPFRGAGSAGSAFGSAALSTSQKDAVQGVGKVSFKVQKRKRQLIPLKLMTHRTGSVIAGSPTSKPS